MGLLKFAKHILNYEGGNGTTVEKSSRAYAADVEGESYTQYNGKPQPVGYGSYEDYLTSYEVNPWIFICVNRIMSSIAQVPLKVWQRTNPKREDWKEVIDPTNKLVKLMRQPNPFISGYDWKEYIASAQELVGNAYCEIVEDGDNEPSELWPLLPHRVTILPDPIDFIKGWQYTVMGRTIKFDADEVIQFKYNAVKDHYYGMPPIRPAENSVIVDMYATIYNKNFFKNSAVPEGTLTTKDELNDPIIKRVKREWNNAHQGVSKAHKIAVLEGGLEYKATAQSARDMQFVLQRKYTREEILSAYGVPPVLAGIMEYANYANAFEQWKQYWAETILPKLQKIEDRINLVLVPRFKDKSLYVEFDRQAVMAMREDKESEARVAATYVDRGIWTINEVRRMQGKPDVEWGDEWMAPLNMQPAGAMMGMEVGPGPQAQVPPAEQHTKFPSEKRMALSPGTMFPMSVFYKMLKAAAGGDAALSPFRKKKLNKEETT